MGLLVRTARTRSSMPSPFMSATIGGNSGISVNSLPKWSWTNLSSMAGAVGLGADCWAKSGAATRSETRNRNAWACREMRMLLLYPARQRVSRDCSGSGVTLGVAFDQVGGQPLVDTRASASALGMVEMLPATRGKPSAAESFNKQDLPSSLNPSDERDRDPRNFFGEPVVRRSGEEEFVVLASVQRLF